MAELARWTREDLPAVAAVERASSPSPWNPAQFAEEFDKPFSHFWVLREGGVAAAFAGFWLVAGEAQLLNIAVDPGLRRLGFGRRLLRGILDAARDLGARRVTLEVREGNVPARRLYESEGFRETFRRPRFYEGSETAVLMEKKL